MMRRKWANRVIIQAISAFLIRKQRARALGEKITRLLRVVELTLGHLALAKLQQFHRQTLASAVIGRKVRAWLQYRYLINGLRAF
jgi:hypothetical protein